MFEQKRLGDNGTSAARQEEFGYRCDETDKQHDQVAHADIVPISTNMTRLGTVWHLCDKSGIRHRHAQFSRIRSFVPVSFCAKFVGNLVNCRRLFAMRKVGLLGFFARVETFRRRDSVGT
jgi:hypothetical protein